MRMPITSPRSPPYQVFTGGIFPCRSTISSHTRCRALVRARVISVNPFVSISLSARHAVDVEATDANTRCWSPRTARSQMWVPPLWVPPSAMLTAISRETAPWS